ncbi:MAG: recombinase family protein, partial [Candidatus Korobacteraceae bacterium]
MKAVIYARVSSREQEQEGYSIPAQLKLLREYAHKSDFTIVYEFVDIETAKTTGRKHFGEMVKFLKKSPDCCTVLVEKTDRLYRNLQDAAAFEELGFEIHCVKTGMVISKNARPQTKFAHDIELAQARFYSGNLREEVLKGMREKAEQGIFPGHAPFGYLNNRVTRAIDVNSKTMPVVQRLFEMYASGNFSLSSLRIAIRKESGTQISRAYLETILKNRFYIRYFTWRGIEYKGKHEPIINLCLFNRVQAAFRNHNKPKYRKHDFPLAGLLRCAICGCTITMEMQKGKYVYCRCSHGHGKCELPYIPEPKMLDMLGEVMSNIYVPETIAKAIVNSIEADHQRVEAERQKQAAALKQQLAALRTRMDKTYEDKLDGRISEEFWGRKMNEWQEQERALQSAFESCSVPLKRARELSLERIVELAQRAESLYLTRNAEEKAEMLKNVL